MARNIDPKQKQPMLESIKNGLRPKDIIAKFQCSSATLHRLKKKLGASSTINAQTSAYIFSHDRGKDDFGNAF